MRTLRFSAAFDEPTDAKDSYGGQESGWTLFYECGADFMFERGKEDVQASLLTGRQTYKIKIRQSRKARRITEHFRLRDKRTQTPYNIRSIDNVTDRKFIYIRAESGVAI